MYSIGQCWMAVSGEFLTTRCIVLHELDGIKDLGDDAHQRRKVRELPDLIGFGNETEGL